MANISFFFPERDKGWALGLNAAGGNIGVAVVQKVIPSWSPVAGWRWHVPDCCWSRWPWFLFVATGIGNGSTYRMISRIFTVTGELAGGDPDTMVQMRRQAAGALGVISAVGAVGGFLVPLAYAWSKAQFGSIEPALRCYVVFFLGLLIVTWYRYLRRGAATSPV